MQRVYGFVYSLQLPIQRFSALFGEIIILLISPHRNAIHITSYCALNVYFLVRTTINASAKHIITAFFAKSQIFIRHTVGAKV